MTADNQIEKSMLSIAKKSVLKALCLLLSFDMQFPKLDIAILRQAVHSKLQFLSYARAPLHMVSGCCFIATPRFL
jgi:hypothetical protein